MILLDRLEVLTFPRRLPLLLSAFSYKNLNMYQLYSIESGINQVPSVLFRKILLKPPNFTILSTYVMKSRKKGTINLKLRRQMLIA